MRHPRLIRFLQFLRSSAVRHTFIETLRRLCVASFVGASWLTYLGKDGTGCLVSMDRGPEFPGCRADREPGGIDDAVLHLGLFLGSPSLSCGLVDALAKAP